MWACTVADVDQRADRVRVMLERPGRVGGGDHPQQALDALALQPGDPVWAAVKASEITTYPA